MNPRKYIILFGTGRCGSTIFHRMLCNHSNLAWLSKWADKNPHDMKRNKLLMQLCDTPFIGRYILSKVSPGECYNFWETHIRGFRRPCRDLLANDVMAYHHDVASVLQSSTTHSRDTLLLKITGWPRVGFLNKILPDSLFIHVIRDGRAVVSSNLKVGFWRGWEGPSNWRWGEPPKKYMDEWLAHDKSFVALAGIQWKILMDAAEKAKDKVPSEKFLEVKYEDLCENPIGETRKVINAVGLNWSERFEKALSRYDLKNTNYKWAKEFSQDHQGILLDVIGDHLRKYGYL